jgi:hydroxypyruvate isomerase
LEPSAELLNESASADGESPSRKVIPLTAVFEHQILANRRAQKDYRKIDTEEFGTGNRSSPHLVSHAAALTTFSDIGRPIRLRYDYVELQIAVGWPVRRYAGNAGVHCVSRFSTSAFSKKSDQRARGAMNRREFSQLTVGAALGQALLSRAAAQQTSPAGAVRFSFMLWALEKQNPFDRCMEIVASAGYNGIELVGEFQKWSPEERKRVMAKMRSLNLIFDSMSGVKAGFADPSQSADFMTQLAAQINSAKELECPQIILLSGKRVDSLDAKTQRQTSIDNLKRAADLATKENIEIVIEPIDPLENPTIFLTTVTDGFEIVRAVGASNVKVLYDFYHEQRAFGNLIEKLEKNINLIGLVHIADVPGRHEPGTGEIDYGNIFRKLAELKYNKFVAMEYYPTEDPVESLKKSRLAAQQAMRSAV